TALLNLQKAFWTAYGHKKQEFRIRGPIGCGKSCAVKILAADIARQRPDITLYHCCSSEELDEIKRFVTAATESAEHSPTIAIFDQMCNNDIAASLGKLGDK